jgi:hypothetical protein
MNYQEKNCCFVHAGTAWHGKGAEVTPKNIVAYLAADGVLTDWHGKRLGSYRITRTWKTPHSYMSDTMNQVRAMVDGVAYTGRSAGVGMVFKGKKVRNG